MFLIPRTYSVHLLRKTRVFKGTRFPLLPASIDGVIQKRSFTSPATEKLRGILREYRKNNFSRELPSRVYKEVLAVADANHDGLITIDEWEKLLKNIHVDNKISHQELVEVARSEFGIQDEKTGIPVEDVLKHILALVSKGSK